MSNAHNGHVTTEHHQGVGTIEFHHPKGNSLPSHLLHDLSRAIHRAAHDPEVRVIVLRSMGKVFCAGASFDELTAIRTQEEGKAFFLGFANVINAMRKCPKFIVARIHGHCIGGGVGLAAASDYCLAMNHVEIRLSELAIGIGPSVIGPAVERKIGLSAFSQLAIDAHSRRNADWARKRGLFAETHPTEEALDEAVRRLTHSLVHASIESTMEMKHMFWHGTEHWDHLLEERAATSARLLLTEAAQTALAGVKKG